MVTDPVNGPNAGAAIVLLIGDGDRSEMRSLVTWLKDLVTSNSRLVEVPDLVSIETRLGQNEFPDLVVVLQSWPQEFSPADINNLFAFAPLARIVVCYGAWCESDARNFKVWPLSVRVPVWGALPRLTREWNLIRNPDGNLPLPWSASREEIFAADHPDVLVSAAPQHVLIDTPDPAYQRFLSELLSVAGHTIVHSNPSVILFDADPWCAARANALREVLNQSPQATVYAIASLIQPSLEAELQEMGVHRLLPKLGEAVQL